MPHVPHATCVAILSLWAWLQTRLQDGRLALCNARCRSTLLRQCCPGLTPSQPAGYGDIVPVTVKEVAMTMAFQVVGGAPAVLRILLPSSSQARASNMACFCALLHRQQVPRLPATRPP